LAPFTTLIYFIGLSVMLLKFAVGLWGGHRLRAGAVPVAEPNLLAMLEQQVDRMRLRVTPAIAICRRITVPIVVGIVKPIILIPASLATSLTLQQLEALLAHELAHIRRCDLLVNMLQRLIEATLFFHPAVWYVSRRVSIEREHACDDFVVSSGWRKSDYAAALVRMAELCAASPPAGIGALAASGNNPSQFKIRIQRLVTSDHPTRLRLTRAGVLMTALLIGSVAGMPAVVRHLAQAHEASDRSSSEAKPQYVGELSPKRLEDIRKRFGAEVKYVVGVTLVGRNEGTEVKRRTRWSPFGAKDEDDRDRHILFDSMASAEWSRTGLHWFATPIEGLKKDGFRFYTLRFRQPDEIQPGFNPVLNRGELITHMGVYSEATVFMAVKPIDEQHVELSVNYLGLEFAEPFQDRDRAAAFTALYGVITTEPIKRRVRFGEEVSIGLVNDEAREATKTAFFRVFKNERDRGLGSGEKKSDLGLSSNGDPDGKRPAGVGVTAGDFNNDGVLDIVIAPDGVVSEGPEGESNSSSRVTIRSADVDNDGDPDLVIEQAPAAPANNGVSYYSGDIDGDGDADVLRLPLVPTDDLYASIPTKVLMNDGKGKLSSIDALATPTWRTGKIGISPSKPLTSRQLINPWKVGIRVRLSAADRESHLVFDRRSKKLQVLTNRHDGTITFDRVVKMTDATAPNLEAKKDPATRATSRVSRPSTDERTEQLMFRGLALSDLPSTNDSHSLADLYHENPAESGIYEWTPGTCFMPFTGPFDVLYVTDKELFFVRRVTDPRTITWYGPIKGDPIEMLDMESYLLECMKEFRTAGNARITIGRMARHGNARLAAIAVRLMRQMLTDEETLYGVKQRHNSAHQTDRNLAFVLDVLQEHGARLRETKIAGLDELDRAVTSLESLFTEAMPDIPLESYNEVGYLQQELPADESIRWGPANNGLRLGLVAKNPIVAKHGDELHAAELFVKNVSDQVIRLRALYPAEWLRADVTSDDGKKMRTEFGDVGSSLHAGEALWRLEPGEKLHLCGNRLTFAHPDEDVPTTAFRRMDWLITRVRAESGDYTGRYTMPLNWRRVVRGKGEWFGELASADFDIQVVSTGGEGAEAGLPPNAAAIAAIQQAGARVRHRNDAPMQPVVAVWFPRPAGAALHHLRHLPTIEELGINEELSAERVALLNELQSLHKLSCVASDTSLAQLQHLPRITGLTLDPHGIRPATDDGLAHLAKMPNLRGLNIRWSGGLTDLGLKQLTAIPNLTGLYVGGGGRFTDAGVEILADCPRLEALYLDHWECTDELVRHASRIQQLKRLHLYSLPLTDAALVHLTALPNLQHLQVTWEHRLTGAGLVHLGELTQLKSLWLTGPFSDDELRQLSPLVELEELGLLQLRITGEGLAHLQKMTRLKTLQLGYCNALTDAGLQHLQHLTALRSLTLWDTKVSDEGLEPLATLNQLRELDVKGTQISEQGFEKLRALLPETQIVWSEQPVARPPVVESEDENDNQETVEDERVQKNEDVPQADPKAAREPSVNSR
jgi:beta-lactamase regulating signal transducer with metallopeptidase domain